MKNCVCCTNCLLAGKLKFDTIIHATWEEPFSWALYVHSLLFSFALNINTHFWCREIVLITFTGTQAVRNVTDHGELTQESLYLFVIYSNYSIFIYISVVSLGLSRCYAFVQWDDVPWRSATGHTNIPCHGTSSHSTYQPKNFLLTSPNRHHKPTHADLCHHSSSTWDPWDLLGPLVWYLERVHWSLSSNSRLSYLPLYPLAHFFSPVAQVSQSNWSLHSS